MVPSILSSIPSHLSSQVAALLPDPDSGFQDIVPLLGDLPGRGRVLFIYERKVNRRGSYQYWVCGYAALLDDLPAVAIDPDPEWADSAATHTGAWLNNPKR